MKTPISFLDDQALIAKLDSAKMAATIAATPSQLAQTAEELKNLEFKLNLANFSNIITVGMGGSGLGAHFINSLFGDEFKIPHIIVNDYSLPEFVGEASLVFLISYSGNTAETLEAASHALLRKSQIFVITTGGKLADFAKKNNLPAWIFEPKFNFCGQSRLGLGYLTLGQILVLSKLGQLEFSEEDFKRILSVTQDAAKKFGLEAGVSKNLAKSTAVEIFGKISLVFAAQSLKANAHIMVNQINENAKMPAFWFILPEAAHHFLESLKSSQTCQNLVLVNLISEFYDDEIKKRFEITKDLALENVVKVVDISLEASSSLEECFAMLVFSSWISYYLAILDKIDPTPVTTVDYFKKRLKG